jgi:hypothetical protein
VKPHAPKGYPLWAYTDLLETLARGEELGTSLLDSPPITLAIWHWPGKRRRYSYSYTHPPG